MSLDQPEDRWAFVQLLLEKLPLIAFVAVRSFGPSMPQRIFIGAALAILVCLLQLSRRIPFSPLYFATNLFFILAAAILLSPFTALADLALALAEVGMFGTILLVAALWHAWSPTGLFSNAPPTPSSKKYSWVLLGVYALAPGIALYFKGNENWAGALPFILITVAEKTLIYCQSREMKRNLQYAK